MCCFSSGISRSAVIFLSGDMSVDPKSRETRLRLEKCWDMELNWDLLPDKLKQVSSS